MKKTLFFLVLLAAGGLSAKAQTLIDIQFAGNDFGGSYANRQTGAAVVGSAADIWNYQTNSYALPDGISLYDVSGLATDVTLKVTPDVGGGISEYSNPSDTGLQLQSTSVANLYQGILNSGYAANGNNPGFGSTFTFSGLNAGLTYSLYVYSAFNNTSRSSAWSLNSATPVDVGPNGSASVLTNPNNFIKLTGVADDSGSLTLQAEGVSGEIDVNGFQLQAAAVPEPSTYGLLLGGFLALIAIRRKRHLAL
jgi:hypothetical protein